MQPCAFAQCKHTRTQALENSVELQFTDLTPLIGHEVATILADLAD